MIQRFHRVTHQATTVRAILEIEGPFSSGECTHTQLLRIPKLLHAGSS